MEPRRDLNPFPTTPELAAQKARLYAEHGGDLPERTLAEIWAITGPDAERFAALCALLRAF